MTSSEIPGWSLDDAIPGPGGSWELLCTEQLSKAAGSGEEEVGISSFFFFPPVFLKRDPVGTFVVVQWLAPSFHCGGPGFNPWSEN